MLVSFRLQCGIVYLRELKVGLNCESIYRLAFLSRDPRVDTIHSLQAVIPAESVKVLRLMQT